jgi:hypothetical protein
MSLDALDRIASLLEHPEDLLPDIAAEAGSMIQTTARAEYAQGIGPAGKHAPRKKDGAIALARPLQTVTFAGVGSTIAGSAEDVLRYHQGPVTKAPYPERKTFPGDGDPLPDTWAEQIDKATQKVLDKATEGLR